MAEPSEIRGSHLAVADNLSTLAVAHLGAWTALDYPLARFDFPRIVSRALDDTDLNRLGHTERIALRTRATDQQTRWHRAFYQTFADWKPLYEGFVGQIVAPLFGEPLFYQAVPTFRVHLPGNLAVGEFHVDTQYGHPGEEITFWVPLTHACGTNSVWIESAAGLGDYRPVTADPGQVVIFDAAHLRHGNLVNRSGTTRVSFDFRCLRERDYRHTDHRSVNTGLAFRPGEYYSAEAVV
jgi:hypothetical protein